MRRLPRHVAARIRSASEADAIHAYENRGGEPAPKTGGPCQLCNKPEDAHYAGSCDDWRPYTPPAAVTLPR